MILETHDLVKDFNGFVAVDGVSVRVRQGEIHALIGPNGAGKTTFFNLLTKFLQPTSGTHLLPRREHHPRETGGHRAPRRGALLSDLRGLSASHGARERARGVAAQSGHLFLFLALRSRAWRSSMSARMELLAEVHLEAYARTLGGGSALRPQARPGTGHHAWRSSRT